MVPFILGAFTTNSNPKKTRVTNRQRAIGYVAMSRFTWTCYKGAILEGEKTNMLNHCIAFTNTLVSSIEDVYKTAYNKG